MPEMIEIDEEVLEVLKEHAEVFVDTPNTVLRRLLGLGTNGSTSMATMALAAAGAPEASAAKPRQPRGGPAAARRTRKSAQRSRNVRAVAGRTRAAHGTLLPESEYEVPILLYLKQQGGRAPSREVIEAVGQELDQEGRLKAPDKEALSSGEVRWKSRAAFVRLRLIERGDLDGEAPRGTWQITDQGRQRLTAAA